jgi:hypothetical protein
MYNGHRQELEETKLNFYKSECFVSNIGRNPNMINAGGNR